MNKKDLMEYKAKTELLDTFKEELNAKKAEYESEVASVIHKIKALESDILEKKEVITEQALNEFRKTGKKKLLGGIGIRVTSKYQYDEKLAFEWAKSTGTCLLLDKKQFEKVGPVMVDFGKTITTDTVTFPKVLKLEEADEN